MITDQEQLQQKAKKEEILGPETSTPDEEPCPEVYAESAPSCPKELKTETLDCEEPSNGELEKQFDYLRCRLIEQLGELKEAEVEISKNEAQIKALADLIAKIDQVVDEYRRKHPDLEEWQTKHTDFFDKEKKCLEAALTSEVAENVCSKASEATNEIECLQQDIENLENKLEMAKSERDDQKVKRDDAKQQLDKSMTPMKSIEARLKELDQLAKVICREHEAQNLAYAYYLLVCKDGFCEGAYGFPKVISPSEVRGDITGKWNTYREEDNNFNEKDSSVKQLEAQLEARRTQLVEADKVREATIRRKLNELKSENVVEETAA